MKKIKLAIIGASKGNGHPYSWSAIINGYDPVAMADCPFPVIPQYLAKELFPQSAIQNAEITHIWTQDATLSHHIAKAAFIPVVVTNMEQFIPVVDGVLLARDDADNHIVFAKPFLEAGLPIYIDKPLAFTRSDAEILFSLQQYPGQIFTCSAFQYSREINTIKNFSPAEITRVEAYIKNDWKKYAIHLIEPILKIIGHQHTISQADVDATETETQVSYRFSNDVTVLIKTYQTQDVKPTIDFFTRERKVSVVIEDVFFAFKSALEKFIEGVREKKAITQKAFVMRSIEMLEKGQV